MTISIDTSADERGQAVDRGEENEEEPSPTHAGWKGSRRRPRSSESPPREGGARRIRSQSPVSVSKGNESLSSDVVDQTEDGGERLVVRARGPIRIATPCEDGETDGLHASDRDDRNDWARRSDSDDNVYDPPVSGDEEHDDDESPRAHSRFPTRGKLGQTWKNYQKSINPYLNTPTSAQPPRPLSLTPSSTLPEPENDAEAQDSPSGMGCRTPHRRAYSTPFGTEEQPAVRRSLSPHLEPAWNATSVKGREWKRQRIVSDPIEQGTSK